MSVNPAKTPQFERKLVMPGTRRASHADLLFGLVVAGGTAGLMRQAQGFSAEPRLFPMAILWVVLLAGLAIAGNAAWQLWRSTPEAHDAGE